SAKLLELLRNCKYMDFLIYAHQLSSLERRSVDWNQKLSFGAEALAKSVANLNGQHAVLVPSARVITTIADASRVDVLNVRDRGPYSPPPSLQISALSEMSHLFSDEDDAAADSVKLPENDEGGTDDATTDVLCDSAIEVSCESGWAGLFAPDEKLN